MDRIGRLKNNVEVKGLGGQCPLCKKVMERRGHKADKVHKKTFYYTQWDYCKPCSRVQHYPEFMSEDWKESERQESFINNI